MILITIFVLIFNFEDSVTPCQIDRQCGKYGKCMKKITDCVYVDGKWKPTKENINFNLSTLRQFQDLNNYKAPRIIPRKIDINSSSVSLDNKVLFKFTGNIIDVKFSGKSIALSTIDSTEKSRVYWTDNYLKTPPKEIPITKGTMIGIKDNKLYCRFLSICN